MLYLEQHKKNGRRHLQSWTGPAAIEHYLQAEEKGRLIQSLKSHLSSRSLTGTEVLGRRYKLEDLVARMLGDLRKQAEEYFDRPIRSAMVGRPVRFVGAETRRMTTLPLRGCARRLQLPDLSASILRWNRWRRPAAMRPRWTTTS